MVKVFIDGAEGTTGLQIRERLARHPGVRVEKTDEALRKETAERARLLNSCDIAILCLPDAAAREAVAMIENPSVRVIDASTAHRTAPGWTYGIPELSAETRAEIASCKRLSNPGCHATGFVMLVRPLVEAGLVTPETVLTCLSVTGYSGGGKKMIADFELPDRSTAFQASRPYAMSQAHKHLPEMTARAGMTETPLFIPVLGDYYKGMSVSLPLTPQLCPTMLDGNGLSDIYKKYYDRSTFVFVDEYAAEAAGPLDPQGQNGTNNLRITVFGREKRLVPTAVFDNLGKGASGAVVQNLNIMAGFPENQGLT